MLIDCRRIPYGITLQSDVVVIGAGPTGITVAQQLAASGRHVLLVDAAGREHTRADDDALDGDGSGEPFPLVKSRHRGFGGTSTHWTPATGLRVRPLDEIDFLARACRPNDSWPISLDELRPFYDEEYRSIGLDPRNDPARWLGERSPTPLAWGGGPQLAMFQFAPFDVFTRRYDEVHRSTSIDLALHGTVVGLCLDSDGATVERAEIATRTGGRCVAVGSVFVLACGTIENVRILLNSKGRTDAGLGNEYDNVGRYFMDHLSVDTGILEPIGANRLGAASFREQHSSSGDRSQPMLWLGEELIRREGIPNAAFWIEECDPLYLSAGVGAARLARQALHSRPRRGVARSVARALRFSPEVARYGVRRVRPRPESDVIGMRILTEQVPNPDSRIRLSKRRDAVGLPRADVDWRVTSADLDVIDAHQGLLARLLADRGVASLTSRFDRKAHGSPIMSNFHHLGGTRMHRDPRHGVVDPDCRIHGTANAYVVGGSVFPTGGYLNPTLTMIALAMRCARVIDSRWARTTVQPPLA